MYFNDFIDYVYSEDSDIIAYGCLHIIKNLKKAETVKVLNEKIINKFRKNLKNKKLPKTA